MRTVAELLLDSKGESVQRRTLPDLGQNHTVRETWFENVFFEAELCNENEEMRNQRTRLLQV